MKSIIILSLLFSLCEKDKEFQNCDDCEEVTGEQIERAISEAEEDACKYCSTMLDDTMESIHVHIQSWKYFTEPIARLNKTSIPGCEACDLWFWYPDRYDRACIAEVNGCRVQIAPITLKIAKLICHCELNTDKGKRKGKIQDYIKKPKFSLISKSCSTEMGDILLYEDGHVGADELNITCYGNEDFLKACEEEKHNYNVDNVVKDVAIAIVDKFFNKTTRYSQEIDCRDYYD